MQKIDKFHRPTSDWWFPGPLQCCNSVGWEEMGVPPLGRASNLAHSFRPRAGARLHGHGPTARSRDWAHVQVPQAQDRSWDASQQHGTATTSSSSCLARGDPAGGKTPGCQPQQGHPPDDTPGLAERFCSSINCQRASARENLTATSVSRQQGWYLSVNNK